MEGSHERLRLVAALCVVEARAFALVTVLQLWAGTTTHVAQTGTDRLYLSYR
jgi:hypothetical protein